MPSRPSKWTAVPLLMVLCFILVWGGGTMGVVGRDTKYPLLVKYIKLKERRRKELTTDENGYSEHFCLSKGESSVVGIHSK